MLARPVKEVARSGWVQAVTRLVGAWRGLVRRLKKQSAAAEIRRLESRKLDMYQEMGRIVYQMYQEDRVRTKRLRGLCETVAHLEAESCDVRRRLELASVEAVSGPRPTEPSGAVGANPG